jgi:hypothetical protein
MKSDDPFYFTCCYLRMESNHNKSPKYIPSFLSKFEHPVKRTLDPQNAIAGFSCFGRYDCDYGSPFSHQELLHFVFYHTQRHLIQLNKVIDISMSS